jgi:N-acetylmuramoyl-L-alanine amidase
MGPQDTLLRGGDKRTNPAVSQILLDLTQRSTRNRSGEFAGMLLDHLSGSVDLLPHSQRDANYFVLLAPDVPAVLLEMGFITNPADELRLTDPDKRRQMMDKVGDAIEDYFAPRAQLASQ